MTGTSHGMNWLESRVALQVSLLVLSFFIQHSYYRQGDSRSSKLAR
uniref:Uncharacterized protein n=1 Tax=Utricularia reniformis TaxID=192314 RepID=A0A1Y0AZY0_9LAMI|nr:hypothetical protein AEK19_MT0425 [Utricularia reniformis]ART30689.1 hypothetical protein AEK19_MT0425 [Utricularia reniformis]